MGDLRCTEEQGRLRRPTAAAEEATDAIIARVQPTLVSEETRKSVIDYVQRLIRNSLGCEVFPFGSVPLKTYLPDGDIDLTAFGGINVEDALANDVCSVLEREDQNSAAEFVVKDVQLIRAEVKVVKCMVQNIVVDISFNQLGGICTLCFLEQVDCLIGKDHLFKRSIILIKAWCYYESRILGAHHGLISTYALETLVLYIFHLFHSSLHGPLAVLYKFLDYFSKFDWDNYCISLHGPVRVCSLPEIIVDKPENDGCNLLLSNDFLKECVEKFSVPPKGFETMPRPFSRKHLNIVDPLKESNNLGRSVSKGNFYRIKSAFTYGARNLGPILSHPEDKVGDEIRKFFLNTLDRHGSGKRPDVQDHVPINGQYMYGPTLSFPARDSPKEDKIVGQFEAANSNGSAEHGSHFDESSYNGVNGRVFNGITVSENRLSGDAKDLASRIQGLSGDSHKHASVDESVPTVARAFHAPHLYFTRSVKTEGEVRDGNHELKQPENSGFAEEKVVSRISPATTEEIPCGIQDEVDDNQIITSHAVPSPVSHPLLFRSVTWSSGDPYPGYSGKDALASSAGSFESFNSLSDLTGDYESHLNSLNHGRWWHDYALNIPVAPLSPSLVTQYHSKSSWDVLRRSGQYKRNVMPPMNINGIGPGPVFYPMNPPLIPGAAFVIEEMPKPRGTGMYFPNTNHYRDRPSTGRARNHGQLRSPRNNGRNMISQEINSHDRNIRDPLIPHQAGGKSGYSDLRHSESPESKPHANINDLAHIPDGVAEYSNSAGHPPVEASPVENGWHHYSTSPPAPTTSTVSPRAPGIERIDLQSYQLKDEEDFPPLLDSSSGSSRGMAICAVKNSKS